MTDETPARPTKECGTCKTPMIMAETLTGTKMPFDVEPVKSAPKGWRLTDRPGLPPLATLPDASRAFGAMLYVPHWATCKAPGQYRKRTPRRSHS